jgi:hypothetical protein
MPKTNHRRELNHGAASGAHGDAAGTDLDSQTEAVRCFARELGRLLGRELARSGFPLTKNAVRPACPKGGSRPPCHSK